MESLLLYTGLAAGVGAGAYYATRESRKEIEKIESLSTLNELASSTPPAKKEHTLVEPPLSYYPQRDSVSTWTSEFPIPDAPQTIINIPKFYNFARQERLNTMEPELGNTKLTIPQLSTAYQQDRMAAWTTNTKKDFMDTHGNILQTESTGVNRPVPQTHLEAIVGQTKVADAWALDPHVKRINDDEIYRSAQTLSHGRIGFERPRQRDTLRKKLDSENTNARSSITNTVFKSIGRPLERERVNGKDHSIPLGYTSVTPTLFQYNTPSFGANPVENFYKKNGETAMTGHQSTPSGLMRPGVAGLNTRRARGKADLNDAQGPIEFGTRNSVGSVNQTGISVAKVREDAKITNRTSERDGGDTRRVSRVNTEFEARKGGNRLADVTTWTPAYGYNQLDRLVKPASNGYSQGAAISSSIADNANGDIESFF